MATADDPLTVTFREFTCSPFGEDESIAENAFLLINHMQREYPPEYDPSMIIRTVRYQERRPVDLPKFIFDKGFRMIGVMRPEGRFTVEQMTVNEIRDAIEWCLEFDPSSRLPSLEDIDSD
jgi:hypothetical protein